eukprot:TRINITY_DN13541_c0_g1_i2.p1 TRINITY_DN13541_c0_g1~~TRINITY_DN13541_c0_g1_i2.p1  ORF type:complete len:315 (-),score=83.88 TRINITY_DN13541_c0_g1_i2:319-1221(-)
MAPSTDNVDELFDVRNAYFTGNFQTCINEAQKLKLMDPALNLERDVFLYRSYLALNKHRVVLDEISSSSPDLVQPLKMLATFLAYPAKRDDIVADLDNKMGGNVDVSNYVLLLVAATIYLHVGQPESALKVLHPSDHLECSALKVQALLSMNRPDLAKKELKNLIEKDEDATLTQLAQAWTNMALGGEKIQEAYYIYQDMIDKMGSTALLLNGQATSFIAQGKYAEAESALQEALDKNPNNQETLVNLIVLAHHSGKQPEVSNRYLSQLKDMDAHHPFVVALNQKEADFDRMCKQYAISA